MKEYLLDDDLFEELIRKDKTNTTSVIEERKTKEKKSVIVAINECKVEEKRESISSIEKSKSEEMDFIDIGNKTDICGFDAKKICNERCKYYATCSRRPNKTSSLFKKNKTQDFTQKSMDKKSYLSNLSNKEKDYVALITDQREDGQDATSNEGHKEHIEMKEDIFAQIKVNRYEHEDVDEFFVDGASPLEVLTIPDKTEKCIIHRCKFEKKNIKYKSVHGNTYGLVLNLCRQCKRVFQEESHVKYVDEALTERCIPHMFYDVGLTNLFLRSQQSAYEMGENEKIYIAEAWVEENPVCPIHEEQLYELTCEKKYSGRKVTFTGYFCDKCNKIIVRKAHVSDIIDECAINSIPEIEMETLIKKAPPKTPMPKKEIKPDYFIQDGKRQKYNYSYNVDCFKLTEEDTVVISNSIYCSLEGHRTEEVLAMIMVKQKRGGQKAYLFMVGYCSECQKYYMEEEDYKVVYGLGRPEITILSDLDRDDYHITSGEVFNLERTHLKKLEDDIVGEITDIHCQPDYVNPFAVGDYDDGNLSFAKTLSKNKYGLRLEKLESYQPKPYNYRVDISADGKTETYYVGAEDIDLEDGRKVISFNSDFGHELVNYQTIKVKKGGKEYDIKLSRQFDIENATLYGYANLRTDEDIVFRSGITDPFLVRVLNMRKKQHNLIDIIATIQENQNKIVDVNFSQSIIVQGCAGSGKTMVLLHRLSSLQYKNRYFDFGKAALILTPNDQFSLHIKGLAEGLQLGNVDRESVEQYYINMLLKYSNEFKPDTKLVSEMLVRQDFVDYIYSDQFIKDFDIAYEKVITERNRLTEILDDLTEAMGQPKRTINFEDDTRVIEQIKLGVQVMDSLVKRNISEVTTAKSNLEKVVARKRFLDEKIPETEKSVDGIVQECLPRVFTKIGMYISNRQNRINQLQSEQEQLVGERQKVQNTIFMFGKKARLEQLDKELKSIERKIKSELKKQEDETTILSVSQEEKTEDEIIAWMRQVMLFVNEVQDEVRLCKNSKEELKKYREELSAIIDDLSKAQQVLEEAEKQQYSDEVASAIQFLYDKTEEYSLMRTYQMVFNEAIESFKDEHKIKTIVGKYHKYDLYAELLFAKRYFKTVHGITKFMCVDEGQDLALNEYRLIMELNRNDVIFNIFGDTNQLMKPGRGISDWSELKKLCGAQEYVLNENYRNTNQITRFCNSSFNMHVLQTGVDGVKVHEIARKELETELSALQLADERLAILVPRCVQKNSYLKNDILPSYIKSVIGNEIGNGLISLLYVDEAKGIEFDKVYVISNKMERNEKYIAYTRALSELIIVVDNNIQDYRNDLLSVDGNSGDSKDNHDLQKTKNTKTSRIDNKDFFEIEPVGTVNTKVQIKENQTTSDAYEVINLSENTVEIKRYRVTTSEKTIIIPNIIDGKSVIGIGKGAYKENDNVNTVIISEGIKYIKSKAFNDCSSLEKVVLPSTLEKLSGNYIFADTALKEINIPYGIKEIPQGCFAGTKFEEITFPDSIVEIGLGAFYLCGSLKRIVLPHSVKKIKSMAFAWCDDLSLIEINDGLEEIDAGAFEYCDSLEQLIIPESVKLFGSEILGKPDDTSTKIFCKANTEAEKYAKDNNYLVELIR